MKLTNKLGLPESIVRAVGVEGYTPGREGSMSVTTLLSPAFIRRLEKENPEAIEEDASDRIWSLVGQIGHSIAERATEFNALSEERLYATILGQEISGQIDLFDKEGVLSDFKFTTIYKKDGDPSWTAQQNVYAWLLRKHGFEVKKAQIIAVFKDWRQSQAGQGDHPDKAIKVIPIELWDDAKVEALLADRVMAHHAKAPAPCTDEERWATAPKYAVMKKGGKKAIKLFDAELDALGHAHGSGPEYYVEQREREYKRCESYCRVSHICPIWKAHMKGKA